MIKYSINNKTMDTTKLAERCFESALAEMELFDEVNRLLGADVDRCNEPGFVWGAKDTRFDSYDDSIEVIRPEGAPPMTGEQADLIFALGFSIIYESIGNTAVARRVNASTIQCRPRMASGARTLRYAAEKHLMARITRLEDMLKEHGVCPCKYSEPCFYACSCSNGFLSGGCRKCNRYGNKKPA